MTDDVLTLMRPPFFDPDAIPFTVSGDVLSVPLDPDVDYEFAAMAELIRLSACFGQYNLTRLFPQARGHYILGDSMRSIRYGTMKETSQLIMQVRSYISSERNGSAAVDIINEKGKVVYGFSHTFHILSRSFFETRFASFRTVYPMAVPAEETLPGVKIFDNHSAGNFEMTVAPFTDGHCLGHFPDFPLVAVAFLYKCIAEGNIQWLNNRHMSISHVENVDMAVSKAIPIDVPCEVEVSVVQYTKHTYLFFNRIFVDGWKEIPHCLLTIALSVTR